MESTPAVDSAAASVEEVKKGEETQNGDLGELRVNLPRKVMGKPKGSYAQF